MRLAGLTRYILPEVRTDVPRHPALRDARRPRGPPAHGHDLGEEYGNLGEFVEGRPGFPSQIDAWPRRVAKAGFEGRADIDELNTLGEFSRQGQVTRSIVKEVVATNDERRFAIRADGC